jgi:hypothetical protein
MKRSLILVAMILAAVAVSGARPAAAEKLADSPASDAPWLWVYAPTNFQVDANADHLIDLIGRAGKAGYTAVVISDTKFGRLGTRQADYFNNMRRTAKAAQEAGVEIIPMVGSFGYSNDLLQNDPNLAEGIAVRDCPFVVHDGKAVQTDDANLLPAGDFETFKGDSPAGWDYVDGPGKSTFADEEVKHGGRRSLRVDNFKAGNPDGNARAMKKLAVKPWRQYHISLWLKTRDVEPVGDLHVAVMAPDGHELNYAFLGAQATQDWTQHHVVVNSLGNESITVSMGLWGGRRGAFWLDDVEMRPVSGVNLVRREGCPLRVISEDGSVEYTEGKDFKRWVDPRMGQVPWEGGYEVYHAGPPLLLAEGSRIHEGDRLKISYYHTQTIYDGVVACCLTHDDVYKYFEESVQQIDKVFHPKKIFISHDELRLADQCELCRSRKLTAGGLLADSVRRCLKIIHKVAPEAETIDWNDMFDPYHNAVDKYYLVGSTLEKSWEGLDKSVIIANWNSGKAADSLQFFAGRGNRQIIAGYYDADDVKAEVAGWKKAAHGVDGVKGFMYTTWRNDYKDLEKYAEEVRKP